VKVTDTRESFSASVWPAPKYVLVVTDPGSPGSAAVPATGSLEQFVEFFVNEFVGATEFCSTDLLRSLETALRHIATSRSTDLVDVAFTPSSLGFVSAFRVCRHPPSARLVLRLGVARPASLGNRATRVWPGEGLLAADARPLTLGATPDPFGFLFHHTTTGWAVLWKGSLRCGRKRQSTLPTRHIRTGHNMKLAPEYDSTIAQALLAGLLVGP